MKVTEEIKAEINYLYYETACNISMIAKHVKLSPATVSKNLGKRPEGVIIPRPTQRFKSHE